MTRRRIDVVAAAGGLAVLILCAIPASTGRVGDIERRVFEAINGLPDALEPPMHAAQLLGILAIGPLVAAIALVARRPRLALAAVLVTVGKLVAERLVWRIVQRDRPGVTEPEAVVRGGTPATGLSFVSGHVVLTAGLAWVVTPYLRGGWRVLPWAVVALVAFARVYLGAHNPLDVLGGAGLGLAIGGTVNLALGVPANGSQAEAGTTRAGPPPRG